MEVDEGREPLRTKLRRARRSSAPETASSSEDMAKMWSLGALLWFLNFRLGASGAGPLNEALKLGRGRRGVEGGVKGPSSLSSQIWSQECETAGSERESC